MKLTELNPKWVNAGGAGIFKVDPATKEKIPSPARHGVGVSFDCPCGTCEDQCFIPFEIALDGQEWVSDGQARWKRTGDTFETLTLEPSIQRVGGCGWHGHIINGEIKKA